MKKQSVTLVQVAAKADVSVMTASRAMSGDGYVSEETRNKVQAAARALGYATNTLARVMKGGRTNVVGVVLNDLASPAANAIVAALTDEVRKWQMDLFIYNASGALDQHSQPHHSQLLHGLWDGLIYVQPHVSDEYLAALECSEKPVVLIDFRRRATTLPVVQDDKFKGGDGAAGSQLAQAAVRELIRRIEL